MTFKNAKIVTHYSSDDVECGGDYYDMELFIDGKFVRNFGDYYHDKAEEKIKGFIEGVEFTQGSKLKIERQDIADRD